MEHYKNGFNSYNNRVDNGIHLGGKHIQIMFCSCLSFVFLVAVSVMGAEYYQTGNKNVYEIVGRTLEQGMEDAAAAIAAKNFSVIVQYDLSRFVPVLNRERKNIALFRVVPCLSRLYRLPESPISIHYNDILILVEGKDGRPVPDYVFDHCELFAVPPEGPRYRVSTMEYAWGYNTVVITWLLLHPEVLDRFRHDGKEPEPSSVEEERWADETLSEPERGSAAVPEETPPEKAASTSCANDGEAAADGKRYTLEELVEEEIRQGNISRDDVRRWREEAERSRNRSSEPVKNPEKCADKPIRPEDTDLLPVTDFLKERGLLTE